MVYSSTLASRLLKLKGLSPEERGLLAQALFLLPLVHVGLLVLGYSRLRAILGKLFPLVTVEPLLPEGEWRERARKTARIVSIAAGYGLYRASCLRRSLLAWAFLRRAGIAGKICFGVRMSDRKLEAHAWVEYAGLVVNDSPQVHERYTALRGQFPPTKAGL